MVVGRELAAPLQSLFLTPLPARAFGGNHRGGKARGSG
jgi:hypothetical protein